MNTIIMNAKNIVNIGTQTNINGRIINEGGFSAETKKIDENKQVEIKGISKIKIDSNLSNVTIFACDQKDIKVHYYGDVCTDSKLKFDVTKLNDEINISEKVDGSTIINNSLKLDVLIPQKIFESISVECENGNIKILKNVEVQHLKIKSRNGKIKSEAFFEKIIAKTINGKIAIAICAKSDIEISASSVNNKVTVELGNIGFCGISPSSVNGSVSKNYSNTGKYEATGKISSINGSVRIQ